MRGGGEEGGTEHPSSSSQLLPILSSASCQLLPPHQLLTGGRMRPTELGWAELGLNKDISVFSAPLSLIEFRLENGSHFMTRRMATESCPQNESSCLSLVLTLD